MDPQLFIPSIGDEEDVFNPALLASFKILQEDGFDILQEDGVSKILTEEAP